MTFASAVARETVFAIRAAGIKGYGAGGDLLTFFFEGDEYKAALHKLVASIPADAVISTDLELGSLGVAIEQFDGIRARCISDGSMYRIDVKYSVPSPAQENNKVAE